MGYSLSMDASVKVKMGDVNGLLNHNARDVDKENGIEIAHSNPDIDSARTGDNETYYYDCEADEYYLCTDKKQITDALQERLSDVKKPLRKDAVVLRPLLLQLDPEYYKEHPDENVTESMDAMMEWACNTFGKQNLISASIHNDETNPHMHVLFCPVTDDGRLSQKDWFANPTALKQMHQDFRQFMTDKGYDVDMQNRKPNKYANRLSVEEYKELAKMQDDKKAFDVEKRAKEQSLAKREASLNARESDLKAQEARFRLTMGKTLSKLENALSEAYKAVEDYEKQTDWYNLDVPARKKLVSQGKSPHGGNAAEHLKQAATTAVHYADSEQNSRIVKNMPDWMREDVEKEEKLRKEEGYYSLF